eukprot:7511245-Alexandrium_andersonii.AAC.1
MAAACRQAALFDHLPPSRSSSSARARARLSARVACLAYVGALVLACYVLGPTGRLALRLHGARR